MGAPGRASPRSRAVPLRSSDLGVNAILHKKKVLCHSGVPVTDQILVSLRIKLGG